MPGLGTIVNVIAIIVGSLIGVLVGRKIPDKIHDTLIKGIGLFTLAIGVKLFLKTEVLVIVLLSILLGGIIGEIIGIEKRLIGFGNFIKKKLNAKSDTFLEGFVSTSLIYCVGPMAILGSIADGMSSEHNILFIKSMLDGTVSVGFAAGLGIGVAFSAIPVLIYQGLITILAILVGHFFSDAMIVNLTAVGGLLIAGIGFNLMVLDSEKRKIRAANFLPAVIVVVLLTWLGHKLNLLY